MDEQIAARNAEVEEIEDKQNFEDYLQTPRGKLERAFGLILPSLTKATVGAKDFMLGYVNSIINPPPPDKPSIDWYAEREKLDELTQQEVDNTLEILTKYVNKEYPKQFVKRRYPNQ